MYDDIINLEHYEPKYHKRMSKFQRAAQFAPFSALIGYSDNIKETARVTNEKIILEQDAINIINAKISYINSIINTKPLIKVIYFVKDTKKHGGKYITIHKKIKKIDNTLYMIDGSKINIDDIIEIDIDNTQGDE